MKLSLMPIAVDALINSNIPSNLHSLEPMIDLTKAIERVIESEVAAGARLKGLSAFLDDDADLKICGEVIFNEAPSENLSAQVIALLYDGQGRVVGKQDTYVGSEGLPFDAFDINIYSVKQSIEKIKVFVKKA